MNVAKQLPLITLDNIHSKDEQTEAHMSWPKATHLGRDGV